MVRLSVALLGTQVFPVLGAANTRIDFNREVRPLLVEHCYPCHGPDLEKRKGGLRLDRPEGATLKLASGARAVVPGNPSGSRLLQVISSVDPDEHMPPPSTGKQLSAPQMEALRRWIEEGAEFKGHWSHQRPEDPTPPSVQRQGWVRNGIDAFILSRLEKEGLAPSPEADRRTLLRRVSLDLIGLPPTVDEVDAFLADNSGEAYEKLVDRLLNSQAYGERMAVPWLDLARFADSDGYHADAPRSMWQYRDTCVLHRPPRAKRVIYLFQSGAPSHLDLFDPKPQLVKMNGKPMPESLTRGQRIAQLMGQPLNCVGSRFRFNRHGRSGMEISELLPHIGSIADDIAMVRSMHTEAINHDPGVTLMQTGHQQAGRPAMGAWTSASAACSTTPW